MRSAALLFFSIFLSLGLLSRQSFSAEATKVIIGVDAPTLSDLPLSVALKKDFFKSEGLNILEVLFRSGPTAMQALVSGSIQFSTGFGTGIRAAMAGAPVKGIIGFNSKPAFILYGRRESGIRSMVTLAQNMLRNQRRLFQAFNHSNSYKSTNSKSVSIFSLIKPTAAFKFSTRTENFSPSGNNSA